jgi:hypothetical protein
VSDGSRRARDARSRYQRAVYTLKAEAEEGVFGVGWEAEHLLTGVLSEAPLLVRLLDEDDELDEWRLPDLLAQVEEVRKALRDRMLAPKLESGGGPHPRGGGRVPGQGAGASPPLAPPTRSGRAVRDAPEGP